jgi:hypothetical protein
MSRARNFKAQSSNYCQSLDFEVIKCPIFVGKSENDYVKDPKRVAIVNDKTDTIISYMNGNSYRLFTNEEFMRLTEKIGDTFGLELNHYAVHNDGQRVLSVFNRTDQKFKVGDYTFTDHLVMYDSRDGSTKLSFGGSGRMHRCQNMFTSTQVQFSVHHSYRLDDMIREFSLQLDEFTKNQKLYLDRIAALEKVQVTKNDAYKLIAGWVQMTPGEVKLVAEGKHYGQKSLENLSTRKTNIIQGLSTSYELEAFGGVTRDGVSVSPIGETGFTLPNMVTNYFTHNRSKDITDLMFGDFGAKEVQAIKYAEALLY